MQLYYSNLQKAGGEQTNPIASLGGYISGSSIPNDLLNNLFSSISRLAVDNEERETFLIILTNTLANDVDNVKIWFDYPVDDNDENISHIIVKLGVVVPTVDDCGDYIFEKINSIYASPLYATFIEANGNGNAIEIGLLESGKSIGIWVQKTINKTNASSTSCDELYDNFTNDVELQTKQTIDFFIHYNEDNSLSLSLSS